MLLFIFLFVFTPLLQRDVAVMGGAGEGGGGGCLLYSRPLPATCLNKLPAAMIGRPTGSCGTGESAAVEFRQISYRRCMYEITHSAQLSISSSVMASGAHIEVVAENPGSVFLGSALFPSPRFRGERRDTRRRGACHSRRGDWKRRGSQQLD